MDKIMFDFNNMFESNVAGGITETEIKEIDEEVKAAHGEFVAGLGKGMMGWTELPFNQSEVMRELLITAGDIRKNFDYFVVLGVGGSSMTAITIFQALKHLHYNELERTMRGGPKFYVEDNIDPERMMALMDVIDIEKTMFNVVTKSGTTIETMSQYLIVSDILKKKLGKNYNKNIIVTTSEAKGNLIRIARAENFKSFYVPEGVGGRFSGLSPVGLLPAAVLGLDIEALLKGAGEMAERCKLDSVYKNPALLSACLKYIAMKKGKRISVMMPYADSLKFIADWFCQLWAESLGKEKDILGKVINAGQTPIKSLGITDQHSQLQLYLEGPSDKVITFVGVSKFRGEVVVPENQKELIDTPFLCGTGLSKLLNTERISTEYTLTKAGRMNETLLLPEVNEYYLGALMMFFMIKAAYCGNLLRVNAYNQPAVDESKSVTYAMFDRESYKQVANEMDSKKTKSEKYIL